MPSSSLVRKCRHRKVRNKILAKIENNSRSKQARETKFVPDSFLDIPASENLIFGVDAGKLHTVNDQQVGLLRTLLKGISNGICVHRAVKETKTKWGRSNHPQNNTGSARVFQHWNARFKGYLFRKFCLAEDFVGELSGLEVGLPEKTTVLHAYVIASEKMPAQKGPK